MSDMKVSKEDVLRRLEDWQQASKTNNKLVTADKVKDLQKDLAALQIDTSAGATYTDVRILFDQAPQNLLPQINAGQPTEAVNKQWGEALADLIKQVSNPSPAAPAAPVAPGTTAAPVAPATTPPASSNDPIKYGEPGTVNPGFPSGTPVPGTGNKPVPSASLDAIPPDSDFRKMLEASDPEAIALPSASGEHGQLNKSPDVDSKTTNTELASKGGYAAIAVDGGKQMVVLGKNAQIQLYDTASGKNLTDSLPFFAKAGDPSGTVIFKDGTRLDLKADDGATFVSGNTVTSVKGGVATSQDGSDQVAQYMANNARNPYNVAVEQGSGSYAQTNGVDSAGNLQWVKADNTAKYTDGDGANDAQLASALNGTAPADAILTNEQAFALNPGYKDYMPTVPANDGTAAGMQTAYATATMAGWTDGNSGASSSRPITHKEGASRIAEGVVGGVLSVLPIGEFLGPVIGRAVEGMAGAVRGGTETGEAGLAAMGRAARGPREHQYLDNEGTHPASDPVPAYPGPATPPPAYVP